jgi:hypothetical protein
VVTLRNGDFGFDEVLNIIALNPQNNKTITNFSEGIKRSLERLEDIGVEPSIHAALECSALARL